MKSYKQIFLLLVLAMGNHIVDAQSVSSDRPNILWIVSEDNSAELMSLYGNEQANTPNIVKLALEGIVYDNAVCTAPVCAPSRSTLITGMYPTTLGTENMRSTYPIPEFIKFFPKYLREAGYYTTNNSKKDYNTVDQLDAWDESSSKATYKNRKPGQPFFAVFNMMTTHESSIHRPVATLRHDPEKVIIPPYLPATAAMKHDWAQYYDKLEDMDSEVGKFVKELEDAGLADNTIIFYYGDNGGILARSKRYMFDNGLHIPLVIRFPEKYANLAPGKPGTRTDRIVSFVDFGPTVLSLAGVDIPKYMQGEAFLGNAKDAKERDYAFSFRGRMDERIDLVRATRSKEYLYVRNFNPQRAYGKHMNYLWNAPSMKSYDEEYQAGRLNEVQSRFFKPKPAEELYDLKKDPNSLNNLAGKKEYADVLKKMQKANHDWMVVGKDAGFIPEERREVISKTSTVYDYANSGKYPVERVIETAEIASSRDAKQLSMLIKSLKDADPEVRYWAATGCIILGKEALKAKASLMALLGDPEVSVRLAAAEALYALGEKEKSMVVITQALRGDNEMAGVHALNILDEVSLTDLTPLKADFEQIVKSKRGEYHVNLANFFLSKIAKG